MFHPQPCLCVSLHGFVSQIVGLIEKFALTDLVTFVQVCIARVPRLNANRPVVCFDECNVLASAVAPGGRKFSRRQLPAPAVAAEVPVPLAAGALQVGVSNLCGRHRLLTVDSSYAGSVQPGRCLRHAAGVLLSFPSHALTFAAL